MTVNEQKQIDQLIQLTRDIRAANAEFMDVVTKQIASLAARVDAKHIPVSLEADILRSAQAAIHEAIIKALSGYDSPITKLTKAVIDAHTAEVREIVNSSFEQVIRTDDFKASIIDAFSHKIARTIISNNDGLFDKVSNELKTDATFKAKMALAVSNVVEECLKERKQ